MFSVISQGFSWLVDVLLSLLVLGTISGALVLVSDYGEARATAYSASQATTEYAQWVGYGATTVHGQDVIDVISRGLGSPAVFVYDSDGACLLKVDSMLSRDLTLSNSVVTSTADPESEAIVTTLLSGSHTIAGAETSAENWDMDTSTMSMREIQEWFLNRGMSATEPAMKYMDYTACLIPDADTGTGVIAIVFKEVAG